VRRVRYAINEKEVASRVLDDGAVIVHYESGYYYTLNATGTLVWEMLSERERTQEELVAELARVFGQDEAAVAADIQQHLDDLRRENLVIVR
jgi:PqqD family protein of HPr-rel-A system